MTFAEWAESFTIFAKYAHGRAFVVPDGRTILTGIAPDDMNADDRARLRELRWEMDDDGVYWYV